VERLFPTFCHLSEYGEQSFTNLHRLLAISSPLVVWAPSGREIDASYQRGMSPINSKQFLELVDRGHIQVVGREEWLLNQSFRDRHPREEAHWYPEFDQVIKERWYASGTEVRVMPPERGYEYAEKIVGRPQNEIPKRRIYNRIIRMYNETLFDPSHPKIPLGTMQKAARVSAGIQNSNMKRKEGLQRRAIALEVLRDARNHLDAVSDSDSDLPFWSLDDGEFIGLLDGTTGEFREEQKDVDPGTRSFAVDYLKQSIEMLASLESTNKSGSFTLRSYENISRYLGSEMQIEASKWFKHHAVASRKLDLTGDKIQDYFLLSLKDGLKADLPSRKSLTYAFQIDRKRFERIIGQLSLLVTFIGFYSGWVGFDPTADAAIELASILLFLIPVVKREVIPVTYEGFRWPFMYAFGSRPTQDRVVEMRRVVQDILDAHEQGILTFS